MTKRSCKTGFAQGEFYRLVSNRDVLHVKLALFTLGRWVILEPSCDGSLGYLKNCFRNRAFLPVAIPSVSVTRNKSGWLVVISVAIGCSFGKLPLLLGHFAKLVDSICCD
jgi:hypothetical protein